jgi:uncharacterized membrane-anchored protein
MSDRQRILLIAVLMTLALVGMVAKKQYTLNTGELIVLKTAPIDPRSLFRGDYVRLNYDISRLDSKQYPVLKELDHDATVYVTLKQQGEFWQPVTVSTDYPDQLARGEVAIRGHVDRPWLRLGRADRVRIKYGIESYFVPEGTGLELERMRNKRRVSLQVAVDRFGNAGIKAVLVDGKVLYSERLF